ncbi:MAG: sulfurtransferase TusA family protein [Burkholderiales bacterium]|jgi:tRNA 2-thiouridine synthesizing protein A|nr:sulfurtransferase TusA family protein [Burkholderiales bacterium]
MSSLLSVFEIPVDRELDACGLNCPLPILRAKKALSGMASGQTVRITATDPGSAGDFQSFAKQTGNTLLAQGKNASGVFGFVLRRK